MDPAIVLFGLGVGVLVGTTGMGGASLMTPLLILIFGVKPDVAPAAVPVGVPILPIVAATLKLRHPEVKPA